MQSNTMIILASKVLLLVLALLNTVQAAENPQYQVKSGPFTVYYTVFPSTFIQPEIAGAYGITRGKNRAIMNVSVRKTLPDGSDREHPAKIIGHSSDLIHKTPLPFVEIKEQGGLYYLAQITITGSPILYFDLKVQPEGSNSIIPINFKQQLFSD